MHAAEVHLLALPIPAVLNARRGAFNGLHMPETHDAHTPRSQSVREST